MVKKHILVADDEENMLNTLDFFLEAASYHVSLADNGQKALDIILKLEKEKNTNRIDLLITDIRMPIMGGLLLIERLKMLKIDIPILVITGYGNRQMIIDLMRAGCSDYLDKPIDEKELLKQVSLLLQKNPRKKQ